jgi:hypothetical protein
MLNRNVLLHGKNEPLPTGRTLHAGPLSLVYENGDLRYLCLGTHEVLRRVYVAVRDRNWGTVPARIENEHIEDRGDSFHITYDARHRQAEIDFAGTVKFVESATAPSLSLWMALRTQRSGATASVFACYIPPRAPVCPAASKRPTVERRKAPFRNGFSPTHHLKT